MGGDTTPRDTFHVRSVWTRGRRLVDAIERGTFPSLRKLLLAANAWSLDKVPSLTYSDVQHLV
jgi:hypothetical protein